MHRITKEIDAWMDAHGISRIGRATQGVRLIQIDDGDEVVSAIRTAESEEDELDDMPAADTGTDDGSGPADEDE